MFALDDTQRSIRALAADFVDREITPHARAWDRAESVDPTIVRRLGELGFLGLGIDERYGGTEVDMLSYALVCEELGRGDSSVRGIVSVSLGLVAKTIATRGTAEQKQAWLPRLTSGETLGCFALTEPDSGSDAAALRLRATPDGADWLLSGEKTFITNGTWADVALVFARTSDKGAPGITAFLVPTNSPGFTASPIHGKLGLRGQATAALSFQDVRVPDSARLGDIGRGFSIALSALTKGRISVAAGGVGVAQAALDGAVRYSIERTQFAEPIAAKQLVQELLAASVAKLAASEAAVRVTNNCLQVLGGYGFIDEYPMGKYLRDARVLTLYEGTSQIQKLLIARALTGIDAM
jgi:alkylation response protein AidB-like acyl-CoA dehydrogenase